MRLKTIVFLAVVGWLAWDFYHGAHGIHWGLDQLDRFVQEMAPGRDKPGLGLPRPEDRQPVVSPPQVPVPLGEERNPNVRIVCQNPAHTKATFVAYEVFAGNVERHYFPLRCSEKTLETPKFYPKPGDTVGIRIRADPDSGWMISGPARTLYKILDFPEGANTIQIPEDMLVPVRK